MIKLNIQLFGGSGDAADDYDKIDATPKDGNVNIKIGANNYSMPKSAFNNVGSGDGSYIGRTHIAAVYAAYMAATGKNPFDVAKEALADTLITKPNPSAGSFNIPKDAVITTAPSIKDYNEYILNTVLTDWVESQGDTLTIPEDYDIYNLNELRAPGKSFTKYFGTHLATDAVKINGQGYSTWKKTQPQLQPGYSEQYGMPVAVNESGNAFVYRDPETGQYIVPGESDNPGFDITALTGFKDLQGNSVNFQAGGAGMTNTETGEIIEPPSTITPPPDAVGAAKEDYINNRYYEDLYSRKEGTLGKAILDNNISLFEKEAQNAAVLADTSMQSQAIQQAQAVKQVTDSVRSERAAQLRAGMSESQLADRELQMLMGGVNQMSEQAQMASQEATAAQLGQSTARENAFNQYIEQTTTLGQNASANYASLVGDANEQAEELRRKMAAFGIHISPEQAFLITTGQTPKAT